MTPRKGEREGFGDGSILDHRVVKGRFGKAVEGGGGGGRQLPASPVCPENQPAVALRTCSVIGTAERGDGFESTAAGAATWMSERCVYTSATPLLEDTLQLLYRCN